MKKAIVCGAGGFIGGHLCRYLKEQGHWVRGVDIKAPIGKTDVDEFRYFDRGGHLCQYRKQQGRWVRSVDIKARFADAGSRTSPRDSGRHEKRAAIHSSSRRAFS